MKLALLFTILSIVCSDVGARGILGLNKEKNNKTHTTTHETRTPTHEATTTQKAVTAATTTHHTSETSRTSSVARSSSSSHLTTTTPVWFDADGVNILPTGTLHLTVRHGKGGVTSMTTKVLPTASIWSIAQLAATPFLDGSPSRTGKTKRHQPTASVTPPLVPDTSTDSPILDARTEPAASATTSANAGAVVDVKQEEAKKKILKLYHGTCYSHAQAIEAVITRRKFALQTPRKMPGAFSWSGGFYLSDDIDTIKRYLKGYKNCSGKEWRLKAEPDTIKSVDGTGGWAIIEFSLNLEATQLDYLDLGDNTSEAKNFYKAQKKIFEAAYKKKKLDSFYKELQDLSNSMHMVMGSVPMTKTQKSMLPDWPVGKNFREIVITSDIGISALKFEGITRMTETIGPLYQEVPDSKGQKSNSQGQKSRQNSRE